MEVSLFQKRKHSKKMTINARNDSHFLFGLTRLFFPFVRCLQLSSKKYVILSID